jgi:23S rRNA pseudouridine1911/1915/1917 synthase
MSLEVLYEDNHLIAVNKRSGDITQGDKTGDTPLPDLIQVWLKEKYNKPGNVFCGVIHRLDRPTTGIVLFAKTSKALARMNEQFQTKTVQKTYWAITEKSSVPNSGHLINYLRKDTVKNKSFAFDKEVPESKKAELTYTKISQSDRYDLFEVAPKTGRHHQIRVQLSHIGAIIKGDLKYGAKRSNPDGSICLHARKLAFTHPVSKEKIAIIAPVPKDDKLWAFFSQEIQTSNYNF